MIFPNTIFVRDGQSFSEKTETKKDHSDFIMKFRDLRFSSASYEIITNYDVCSKNFEKTHNEPFHIPKKNQYGYITSLLEKNYNETSYISIMVDLEAFDDYLYCIHEVGKTSEYKAVRPSSVSIILREKPDGKPDEILAGRIFVDSPENTHPFKGDNSLHFELKIAKSRFDALLENLKTGENKLDISLYLPLHIDRIEDYAALYEYPQTYIVDDSSTSFAALSSVAVTKVYPHPSEPEISETQDSFEEEGIAEVSETDNVTPAAVSEAFIRVDAALISLQQLSKKVNKIFGILVFMASLTTVFFIFR